MININGVSWHKLSSNDIKQFLSTFDDESFFVEFKNDAVDSKKLTREISAFANTYGGYVFLGVEDNKSISGCKTWTEQRIHVTIHDSLTPTPNFDIRKFDIDGKVVFIIKVEEGTLPPYITNKGEICERISSGSFTIKDSSKLNQLYQKQKDQLLQIKKKIELPLIQVDNDFPQNIFAYVDFGFSVTCSEWTPMEKASHNLDLNPIADKISFKPFSISRVGLSYLFSLGNVQGKNRSGEPIPVRSGIHNFIEIMPDGSARGRILLLAQPDSYNVDITPLISFRWMIFQEIYALLFGEDFSKIFIHAHKFERLTVLKQFTPVYAFGQFGMVKEQTEYLEYLKAHKTKYGNNLIIESNRCPVDGYFMIDQSHFNKMGIEYNTSNLYKELFYSEYSYLGYIDAFKKK